MVFKKRENKQKMECKEFEYTYLVETVKNFNSLMYN